MIVWYLIKERYNYHWSDVSILHGILGSVVGSVVIFLIYSEPQLLALERLGRQRYLVTSTLGFLAGSLLVPGLRYSEKFSMIFGRKAFKQINWSILTTILVLVGYLRAFAI